MCARAARAAGTPPAPAGAISPHETIEAQKSLRGMDYPARKADLIAHASRAGVTDGVRALLERLPDMDFEAPIDVSQAIAALA